MAGKCVKKMTQKFVYVDQDLLMIHDTRFPKVRILNLKTGYAEETNDVKIIEKVRTQGEEVPISYRKR